MYYIIAYPETTNHLNYNTVRGFQRSFLLDSADVRRAYVEAHSLPFQRWSAARPSSVYRSCPSPHWRDRLGNHPDGVPETGTNSTLPPAGHEPEARAPTSSDNGLDRLPFAHIRGGQHTRASTPSAHVQNVCLQKAFCPQLFALSSTSAMIAEPIASLWKAFLSSVVRPLPLPLWKRKGGRGKVRGQPPVRRPARTRRTIAQPGLYPLARGCGPSVRAPR